MNKEQIEALVESLAELARRTHTARFNSLNLSPS